ncbi:rRNA biogenesis protein rrp5 [Dimargaris verticillata]|uniref:rRNA biogenesis protein rrp5 n=1 Tax=Dimargaris verticillata TaxID=2761393 RepID=A0A9W8E849_9FUNG|nr:rRNA biogenesis protein rrp5 [Dimargaris verticillata]
MTQPDVVVDICRAIHAVSNLPLSIKCRTGVDHHDSYEFLANFIAHITSRTQVNQVIVHARKALLLNIPARKNLVIPPLNYDRVRALKRAFPHLSITLNGGIATTDVIQRHLAHFDGVMLGRKVRDDPLFLLDIDQVLHGTARAREQVQSDILGQYLAYADAEQAKGFSSLSVLTKPVHYLVDGLQGKAFRGILGRTLAQTKRGTCSVSHLVHTCLQKAQQVPKSKKSQAKKSKGANNTPVPVPGKPPIIAPSVASIPAPRRPQTAFPRGADDAPTTVATPGPRQTWAEKIKEQKRQNHLIRKHKPKDIPSLRFHTDTKPVTGASFDYALPRCDLVAGSHVLGAVQAFDDHRVFVDLPGSAKGVLPITNVSTVLTTLLKIAAGMEEPGSADTITVPSNLDADYVRPRNLFYLNQWLHCVVLSHEVMEDGDQTHQVYELSVDPELANEHLTPEDLTSSSMVVGGTVRAQSDDGYVVDLGGDHLTGFISLENAQLGMLDQATSEQPLAIGQYLLFETSGQPASDGLAQLTVVHEGAFSSPTNHLSTTAAILPGMLVSATITAVATRGLECLIMDTVKATIHWYHADGVGSSHSSVMLTKYQEGQIIQARVLATDDTATDRPLALANRWYLVNMATSAISTATGLSLDYSGPVRLGSQIPVCVSRTSAKMGLVGSAVDIDGVVAVAPPDHWHENPAGVPETDLADFQPGQWVTACVLKYSPCENTITASIRPVDLAQKYWQLSDVLNGQRISGVITEVTAEGVRVEIAPEIFGFLPLANIPKDSALAKRSHRKVGKPVDAIVWSADGVSDPTLTCHKGLLETTLRLDYKGDQYGVEYLTCALVIKVRRGDVHVEFPGGQRGVIKADNVAQAQATDPNLKPVEGEAIRCYRAGPGDKSSVAVKLLCQTASLPEEPSADISNIRKATDADKGDETITMALDAEDDDEDKSDAEDDDYKWIPSPLTVLSSEPRPKVSTSKAIKPATLRRGTVVQKTAHTIIVQLYPTNVRAELPRAHLSDHLGPIVDAQFSRVQVGDQVDQCVVVRPYEPVLISRKPLFLTMVKSGLNMLREPQSMTTGQLVPGFVTGVGKSARVEFLSGVQTSIYVGQLADYFVGEPKQHLSRHQTVLAALQNDQRDLSRTEFTLKTSKTIEPLLMAEHDEKSFHYPVARLNLMGLFATSFFSELDVLSDAALSTRCLGQYVSGKVIQELPNGLIVDLKDDFCGFVAKEHLENPKPTRGDHVVGRILDFSRSKSMADLTLLSETMVHREVRNAPATLGQLLRSDAQSSPNEPLAPVLKALQSVCDQRQEIEARVQLIKDNYLVLTIPTMDHAVMFAMATSYNDHRRPAFKYAVGDSYGAVLCQVPSSTTASNLRIVGRVRPYSLHEAPGAVPQTLADSADRPSDTQAPMLTDDREAPKALRHSPADITPGAIVDVQITRINRTSMHVRLADNTVGIITPLDVVDSIGQLKDSNRPFAHYTAGQIVDAKVVQSETGAALPFLNMRPDQTIHILSLRPGELDPTTAGRVVHRPPTVQQLVIGQTYLGFVIATRNRVLTVTLPGGVKGHSGGFHLSCKPQVLESVDSHFTVGGVVLCRLVGLAGELAQVVIMSGEYPGIDMPKQMEVAAPESATLCIMGTCTLGYMVRFPDAQSQCGYILWTEVADDYDQLVQKPLQLNQEVQGVVYARITYPMNAMLVSLRASRRAMVDGSNCHPAKLVQADDSAVSDPVITAVKELKRGQIVRGFVRTWVPTGVIVSLGPLVDAFCPIRQLSRVPLAPKSQAFRTGQLVTGMINKVPRDNRSPVVTLDRTRFDPTYHVFNREHFHVNYASMGRVMAVSHNAVAINLKYSDVIGICALDEMADETPEAVRQRLLPGDGAVVRVIANDEDDDRLKLTMRASAFTKQEAVALAQDVDNDDMYFAWFQHRYGVKANDSVDGETDVGEPTAELETGANPAPSVNDHSDSRDAGSAETPDHYVEMDSDMDEDQERLDPEPQFESEDDDDAHSVALSDTGSVQEITSNYARAMDSGGDDDDADDLPEVAPPSMTGVNVLNALPAKRGFDWDDSEPAATDGQLPDDDSDADQAARAVDDEHLAQAKKRRKKDKDDRLVLAEDITGDLDEKAPAVASDFERLLVGSPDSSYLWINYMAFHLKLAQVEKARAIGERALKTINFREEQEKFNMWVAMFNLENQFGSRSELDALVMRALRVGNPKKIYIQLATIYERSNKTRLAEKTHLTLLKKFSGSCKAWTLCGAFYLRHRMSTKAHELLQRCIQVLPKRKHLKAISRFGIMEFKEGDPERGRTIFEGIISNHPKRLDLWSVFIDMETKAQHLTNVRMLFQRVLALNLSTKKTKFFFKKWLAFEKKFGSIQDVEAVKQRALEYVQSVVQN